MEIAVDETCAPIDFDNEKTDAERVSMLAACWRRRTGYSRTGSCPSDDEDRVAPRVSGRGIGNQFAPIP
jgi:hypothetical protein